MLVSVEPWSRGPQGGLVSESVAEELQKKLTERLNIGDGQMSCITG